MVVAVTTKSEGVIASAQIEYISYVFITTRSRGGWSKRGRVLGGGRGEGEEREGKASEAVAAAVLASHRVYPGGGCEDLSFSASLLPG